MKRLLILAAVLLFAVQIAAQVPAVQNASRLEWDHSDDGVTEYRVYIQVVPGVSPDGTSYVAQVAHPSLEWLIQGLTPGIKYAVCTAYYADTAPPTETGPSNEIVFRVLETPTNFRVIVSQQLGLDVEQGKLVFYGE